MRTEEQNATGGVEREPTVQGVSSEWQGGQYSLAKILGIWAAAAFPIGALGWVATPWLSQYIHSRDPFIDSLLICFNLWMVALVLILVQRERRSLARARDWLVAVLPVDRFGASRVRHKAVRHVIASHSEPDTTSLDWKRMRRATLLVVTAAITLLLAGCGGNGPGDLRTESRAVDPHGAKSVSTHLEMGFGTLNVEGGTHKLMEADFAYGNDDWKPRIEYGVNGEKGTLKVWQGSDNGNVPFSGLKDVRNDWTLHLNDRVPEDLRVEMGAGKSDLRLGSISLKSLDVQMGAGAANVDLTGDWDHDLNVDIEGGAGYATLRLPTKVGARVNVRGGFGRISADGLRKEGNAYVNDAYGNSDVTLNVDFEGGVGQVNLEAVEQGEAGQE
ncbi:MAG TPA: toast rack family protein [Rubrobacteraceae bacterium]|nr:toast rack family protein [Rubrobacteraceae bacterium]